LFQRTLQRLVPASCLLNICVYYNHLSLSQHCGLEVCSHDPIGYAIVLRSQGGGRGCWACFICTCVFFFFFFFFLSHILDSILMTHSPAEENNRGHLPERRRNQKVLKGPSCFFVCLLVCLEETAEQKKSLVVRSWGKKTRRFNFSFTNDKSVARNEMREKG